MRRSPRHRHRARRRRCACPPPSLRCRCVSIFTNVPPSASPGLKVRYCSLRRAACRTPFRMRDASYTAPAPTSGLKICDECAGMPVVVSVHEPAPRREIDRRLRIAGAVLEAERRRRRPSRRRSAPGARRSSGVPASSSSPLKTTVDVHAVEQRRRPSARAARRAMMTSPPFMSMMPGPRAVESLSRSNV